MKRTAPLGLALLASVIVATTAQAAAPTPSSAQNPHVYVDSAMRVTVPDDYRLLGMRHLDPTSITDQQVVAVWTKGSNESRTTIVIAIEPFSGLDLDAYETQAANTARQAGQGVLVDKKIRTSTANKMPAYWLSIVMGSGFNSMRRYEYIWTDGVRGVTVAISGPMGAITEDQAKAALSNIYATSYPGYHDQ